MDFLRGVVFGNSAFCSEIKRFLRESGKLLLQSHWFCGLRDFLRSGAFVLSGQEHIFFGKVLEEPGNRSGAQFFSDFFWNHGSDYLS